MKTKVKAALWYWVLSLLPIIIGVTGATLIIDSLGIKAFIGIFLFGIANGTYSSPKRKETIQKLKHQIKDND